MQPHACRDSLEVVPFVNGSELLQQRKSVSRTVFDVGMNNGDDSRYYLSKGYTVVAVEANPVLVRRAHQRFRAEIASGQMVIEALGIRNYPGRLPFWINEQRAVFSSFDRTRACRQGTSCHAIEVDCITLDSLLENQTWRCYLKLD